MQANPLGERRPRLFIARHAIEIFISAVEEQSQTSNEIARSLSQLSALGGKVMFELKDTAENTEHLKGAAEQLERLIGQFKTAHR